MARPRKWRKVCCLPETTLYGALNGADAENENVTMTIEEYEVIRLIDLEDLTQLECAEKMQIARTSVQNIYKNARSKMAESLVNGSTLKIEGGYYKLYNEIERKHGCRKCRKKRCQSSANLNEQIAE